ncbi:MAG: hypothetical protein JXB85_09185 [Anaerolineales bacterium]|nr:hypothetical protein [Anaerolineales bacterium]
MQGRLRYENLSFTVKTECGHCGWPITLEIDSDLQYRVLEANAEPLVYAPMLDISRLEDPSIIDGF